ncbi:hypothetical protein HKX48_007045 [Thoreauomyces humboldtii]|nr:hypothetical protein HKX48_007045 [Thoreauomyces humboldtii]
MASPPSITVTDLIINTKDAFPIAATLYAPAVDALSPSSSPSPPHPLPAAVLINAATGVSRRFYGAFARYLAETHGAPVLTWDYRGIGDSGSDRLPTLAQVSIKDHWATRDLPAVTRHLKDLYPDRSLVFVGNSVGCHLAPVNPEKDLVDRYLFVNGNNAYYKHHVTPHTTFFFRPIVEVAVKLYGGYFPASKINLCDDLPTDVARDWARWTHHPEYCTVDPEVKERYDAFAPPSGSILHVAMRDDELVRRGSNGLPFTAFNGLMPNARIPFWFMKPDEATEETGRLVGHLGWFKKHCRKGWDAVAGFVVRGDMPVGFEGVDHDGAVVIKAKL